MDDQPLHMVAGRDLPGMETYEQNDAALGTYLMDQRQSLRKFDAPQDIQDSYRDMMEGQTDANYSLLRKSSFMPQGKAGDDQQMDDLIAQNFAKLMRANEQNGQMAIRRVTTNLPGE